MAYFPKKVRKSSEHKKAKEDKQVKEYYDSSNIRELNASYNLIMGERGPGKTYDAGVHMVQDYYDARERGELNQSVYLRRWKEDLTNVRASQTFDSLVCNGKGDNVVVNITNGEFNQIVYKNKAWYLATFDVDLGEPILDSNPFCYAMMLPDAEHDKGRSFPHVNQMYFDEFIPLQGGHIVNEFVLFCQDVSTVMRRKRNFKVYMLANTLNRQDQYFTEMGLYHVRDQEQGTIEVYQYKNNPKLTVAVELCGNFASDAKREADAMFAFDSPQLDMITNGSWSLEIYPHLPMKYTQEDIVGRFYISYDGYLLDNEIIQKDDNTFIYCHNRTKPIDDENELIYAQEYDPRPNWRRNITKSFTERERKILRLINMEKIYFQDNQIGDIFSNYLEWCKQH